MTRPVLTIFAVLVALLSLAGCADKIPSDDRIRDNTALALNMPSTAVVISDRRHDKHLLHRTHVPRNLCMRHEWGLRDGHGHDKPPGMFAAVNDATKPGGRSDLSDHGLTRVDEAASVKGPRKAPPDIGLLGELKAAVTRIELRQTVHEQVAHRVIEMLMVHNEKLDAILEAATREPGPSPVLGVLADILESLHEQQSLLAGLPGALAESIRDELQRELGTEDPEMEPAGRDFFDNRTNEGH